MKWALIGISIILVFIALVFLNVSQASTRILNKFIDYSDKLHESTNVAFLNHSDCLFYGADSMLTQPTYIRSTETIAVIWLHGLGGNATRAYENLRFSKLTNERIHFFLPTANKILTPWMKSGLKNSWFTLDKIQSEKKNAEAIRASNSLIEFIRCIQRNGNYTEIIVGGSSQGGAVAWLAANIGNSKLLGHISLSYVLLNTWLPVSDLPATNLSTGEIYLIHNSFDDIVADKTVHDSIENSRELMEIRTLYNHESLHKSNTEEHIEFVHQFIKNKLSNF